MKALVTGSTGLIGSSLVRELLKDGVEVRAVVREKSDTRNIDGLEIERVKGDIRDSQSMEAALKGCDVFYQAAALYSFQGPAKTFYDINVEGTKTALAAALKVGVPKVVYTSSIAAVGFSGSEKPADEKTQWNLAVYKQPYLDTKYQGELAALDFYKKGLPVVIVNPALVIGVRDIKPTPSGQIVLNVLEGKFPGCPDGGMNLIDAEDVARGHILAAQKGETGERYILGNTNINYKDLFKMVADVAGTPPISRRIPSGMMVAMGYMLQTMSVVTRKPPSLTANSARFSCQPAYYDCSKAVNELGIPQTPLRTTLEKTIKWFRDNGYTKK